MTVESARSRAKGLTMLILMDIAESMGKQTSDMSQEWRDFAEAVATGVFVEGRVNRIAHVGVLAYTASQLP